MRRNLYVVAGIALLTAMLIAGIKGRADSDEKDAAVWSQAEAVRSWSVKIDNAHERFLVLSSFGGNAVLDRETQLVWQRSPSTTTQSWPIAEAFCNTSNVANRLGWRLPTVQEMGSLIDPTVATPGPTLPPGNPFLNVQQFVYWTATSVGNNTGVSYVGVLSLGIISETAQGDPALAWCVRGVAGSGVPANQ